jgi:hypothetical protein
LSVPPLAYFSQFSLTLFYLHTKQFFWASLLKTMMVAHKHTLYSQDWAFPRSSKRWFFYSTKSLISSCWYFHFQYIRCRELNWWLISRFYGCQMQAHAQTLEEVLIQFHFFTIIHFLWRSAKELGGLLREGRSNFFFSLKACNSRD